MRWSEIVGDYGNYSIILLSRLHYNFEDTLSEASLFKIGHIKFFGKAWFSNEYCTHQRIFNCRYFFYNSIICIILKLTAIFRTDTFLYIIVIHVSFSAIATVQLAYQCTDNVLFLIVRTTSTTINAASRYCVWIAAA